MPSTIETVLFGEPAGRPNSLVQFTAAAVFLAIYAYAAARGAAASGEWLLVMALAATLSGVAESLPKDRRRAAGGLRLTAILALVCLLAVVTPDLVTG